MDVMRRRFRFVLALMAWLLLATVVAAQDKSAAPPAPEALPGSPAPPEVAAEIQRTVDAAMARFQAMDEAGLLVHVSAQYRTGTLTKAGIAEQIRTVFAIHDQVRARVRIDAIRMVGEHAWVYSTGNITGRVRFVGGWVQVGSWERELEVGRREDGRWRLYGYQQ
jgi:hypothetical protein